ncbi:hypothetical protein TrLO_g12879 [Triparma laevis f. longispina]|uniref:PX domain-containing protein n=1 Tax=Triparma laevis f. longispina TaxID=1714387 RepID=A0A9W7EBC5_9STRA|nr:hypothetical protein TrLO_g12879 [Triparma laevis f. longispina]
MFDVSDALFTIVCTEGVGALYNADEHAATRTSSPLPTPLPHAMAFQFSEGSSIPSDVIPSRPSIVSSGDEIIHDLPSTARHGLIRSTDFTQPGLQPNTPQSTETNPPLPPGFSPPQRGFSSKPQKINNDISPSRLNSNSSDAVSVVNHEFPIKVEVPRTSEESESSSRYTVYHLEITTSLKKWTVLRRYKEFDALHQSILENAGDPKSTNLPKFPAKKMFPMSSMDKATVEERRKLFHEYMKGLLTNPSIFNPHLTPSTKAIINFLDHDGTLAMQVKCFLLESKVQQLTYAYRELQQSRELTEQLAVGQTRMIDMLQQRLEALENATHTHGSHHHHHGSSQGMTERFTDDSRESSFNEGTLPRFSSEGLDQRTSNRTSERVSPATTTTTSARSSRSEQSSKQTTNQPNLTYITQPLPSPPPTTYAAAAAAANNAIKSTENLQLPPPSNRQRSSSASVDSSENDAGNSFALSETSNTFLFRNSGTIPGSLQTSLFQPGRSVSVGDNMLRNPKVDLSFNNTYNVRNTPHSTSITIPTNAAKELMMARRHSSDDGGRRTTGSFTGSENGNHLSMINDILSPSTPPSPSFAKHRANSSNNPTGRSHSTTQPSNPWGGDNSRGLAFVSSPPNAVASEFLPVNLVPKNVDMTPVDKRAQELIYILQPSPEAILHRKRVVKYTSQHIKQTLGAQCFPIGAYALKTYLPDDWLHLSAFLCQGQEQTWFIKVNEVLCKTSNSPENNNGEHKISNVNFSNEGESRAIRCTTDGVNVDMTANSIEELYQVAFLEEVDLLLGKDHLFKRSIILIKAWWLYETRAFSGQTMLASVSEFALTTMLLAIVNKYHARLQHPLQVLSMFFSVYCKLDWAMEAITVQGIVEVDGGRLGKLKEGFTNSDEILISPEMILRYQQRCGQSRINANGRTASTTSVHTSVDTALGQTPSMDGTIGDVGNSDGDLISRGNNIKFDPRIRTAMFTTGNMNIQNPLDPGENLVHSKVSERRANRFSQVLQAGAKNLQPILSHLDKEQERGNAGGFNTSVALFDNFFSNAWSRFGQGWRPDIAAAANGSGSPTNTQAEGTDGLVERLSERDSEELNVILRGDIFDGQLDTLRENLKFCSFLLEREITQSALKTLSQVVLEEKGPMPVGEIGKMLQEATANPSLSGVLKESFGGLKKFLEKFPEIFLISQDHPFNPHVYLRAGFTLSEQQQISVGSTEFLSQKTKKKTRRKGRSSQGGGVSIDSPMVSGVSSDGPSRDLMNLQRQQRQNSYSGVAGRGGGGGGAGGGGGGGLKPGANSFVPRSSSRA